MKIDRLLKLYERIADAPDAVERLRRFILDLAVHGKLVPQDPADEPASALLARRKIALPNDGPFELPRSWAWAKVGAVADARLGKMLDKSKNKGTPRRYLRNINVRWFDFDLSDVLEMRFEDGELPEFKLRLGDVLICEGGEPGRAAVWDERETDIYFQKAIHRVRFFGFVDSAYFVKALRASADDGRLAEYFTGTGIKHFTGKGLDAYLFPLPPFVEQKRIVAKVDELMALCDRLGRARTERDATRDRLMTASLARLNDPDPETFRDDARFALNALPAMTARADQIKQVRQTILNLAVRGKLVPQDPNDEPASELLERITKEKARLMKAGDIPRHKEVVRNTARLIGDLPTSWEVLAFGATCNFVTSGSRGWAEFYAVSGPRFIRAQNIRFGKLKLDDLAFVKPPANSEGSRTQVAKGDLLIVITGAGVTNPALLDRDFGEAYVSQHVGLVRPTDKQLSDWFLLCLMAPAGGRAELIECAYGAGRPGLNLDNIRSLSIPLPPLAEQKRIVAKVDELMTLCDRLEACLTAAEDTRRRLLDTLVHEALQPIAGQLEEAA